MKTKVIPLLFDEMCNDYDLRCTIQKNMMDFLMDRPVVEEITSPIFIIEDKAIAALANALTEEELETLKDYGDLHGVVLCAYNTAIDKVVNKQLIDLGCILPEGSEI